MKSQPMQPVVLDEDGRARFQENKIVRFMLDCGKIDLNMIAHIPFDNADREQFAQLIGYAVDSFAELPYASEESIEIADKKASELFGGD